MENSSPRRSRTSLVRLDSVLGQVLARLGINRNLDDYRIWEAWDEVVGPAIANNAQPARLYAQRLVVTVRTNTWLQELSLLRGELCRRLNEKMGRRVVKELFLVVGRVEPEQRQPQRPRPASPTAKSSTEKAPDSDPRSQLTQALDRLWQTARAEATRASRSD